MDFFVWDNSFSVGVKDIDEQHKKLITLINELATAMSEGKGRSLISDLIKELKDYTVTHFSFEEKLMEKYNYPGLAEQKNVHNSFIEKIKDFDKQNQAGSLLLSIDIFQFLKDWLKEHILGMDMKYADFFREKGVN